MSGRSARRLRQRNVASLAERSFHRIDDPELAVAVSVRTATNNALAVKAGLPAVGSRLVNKFGIEWVVDGHVHVPTTETIQRWREGQANQTEDLFPSIVPQNLSERLIEFISTVDRCTTKTFLNLDTMPDLRQGSFTPGLNAFDSIGNPGANLVFLDAARVHETVFAHEIGHAWVQYVDEAEDHRVLKQTHSPQLLHQVHHVQSFVLDLRVNDVIRDKGFDMSAIRNDQAASIASLGRAIDAGFRPESPREENFMALLLAAEMLERDSGRGILPVVFDTTLAKLTSLDLGIVKLAEGFAETVRKNGYDTREGIIKSIDECLLLSFDHTGDGIDLENDLVIPDVHEPDFDKYPRWLEGAPTAFKCSVGKIMAKENIPSKSRWQLSPTPDGKSKLSFDLPDGSHKGPWRLEHSYPWQPSVDINLINEINRRNRERLMNPSASPSPTKPFSPQPFAPGQPRRFYMAGLGRWLTAVREAEWLDGEHPYAYAFDSPATYVDPLGLDPCAPKECCCSLLSFDSTWSVLQYPPKWGHAFTVNAKVQKAVQR